MNTRTIKRFRVLSIMPAGDWQAVYFDEVGPFSDPLEFIGIADVYYDEYTHGVVNKDDEPPSTVVGIVIDEFGTRISNESDNFIRLRRVGTPFPTEYDLEWSAVQNQPVAATG